MATLTTLQPRLRQLKLSGMLDSIGARLEEARARPLDPLDFLLLLLEDEEGVRRLAHKVLEKCGYTVLEAAGWQSAMEKVAGHAGPIHLLLTDWRCRGQAAGRPFRVFRLSIPASGSSTCRVTSTTRSCTMAWSGTPCRSCRSRSRRESSPVECGSPSTRARRADPSWRSSRRDGPDCGPPLLW